MPVRAAVPAAAAEPAPDGGTYSYSGLKRMWTAAGGSPATADRAACIAEHESSGRPGAISPSNCYGLWQIMGRPGRARPGDERPDRGEHVQQRHQLVRLVDRGELLMRAAAAIMVTVVAALVFTVPARAATRPPPQALAYAYAVAQHGKPFAWAGTGPYAFDCSGLVYAAYRHAGVVLPRDTYGMVRSRQLERISRAQARRGDLAFYGPPGAPEHVAMVDIGNVVFCAYRSRHTPPDGRDSRWWSPDALFRVRARGAT